MKTNFMVGLAALGIAITSPLQASDHVDGLRVAIDKAADITDLYTFPSPKDASKLVLIMNVYPKASATTRFSDAVDYTFRIRSVDPKTLRPQADGSKEKSITCRFDGSSAKQQAACTFNAGGKVAPETLRFETRSDQYQAGGTASQGGMRAFAGVRSDPWFIDLASAVSFNAGKGVQSKQKNGLEGTNVLAIVIEVDKSRLVAGSSSPLLAVTTQTVRRSVP